MNYWQSMVTARYDLITGIADAQVRAFSPKDAQLIASTLVTLAEELINKIEKRSQEDAVRFAEQEVEKQKDSAYNEARESLTAYRNKFGIIDPTSQCRGKQFSFDPGAAGKFGSARNAARNASIAEFGS